MNSLEKYIITIGKGENMRVYQFAKELGKDSQNLSIEQIAKILTKQKEKI